MRHTFSSLPILLAACMNAQSMMPPPADTCGTGQHQAAVGGQLAALDQNSIAVPIRVLTPGSAMTMDHRPDRLNIHVDATGRITRLTCG